MPSTANHRHDAATARDAEIAVLQRREGSETAAPGVHGAVVRERLLVKAPGMGRHAWLHLDRLHAAGDAVPTRAAVLLLHGFGQNRYTFEAGDLSLPVFLALRGCDVYSLEMRGHGRSRKFSDAPPSRGFDEYVLDAAVAAAAARRLSGCPLFVLGHSLGGAIAYAVTPLLTPRPGGVITIAGVYHMRRHALLGPLARVTAPLRGAMQAQGKFHLPIRPYGRVVERTLRLTNHPRFRAPLWTYHPGSFDEHVLRHRLRHGFDQVSSAVFHDLWRFAAELGLRSRDGSVDYTARFARENVPLLVIAGDRDQLTPPPVVRPAYEESASRDKHFLLAGEKTVGVSFGHLDLILGRHAPEKIWAAIARFVAERAP